MTRKAIRHTLSAFAAIALVSAFASSPASAGELSNTERELVDSLQTMNRGLDKPTFGEKFTIRTRHDHDQHLIDRPALHQYFKLAN